MIVTNTMKDVEVARKILAARIQFSQDKDVANPFTQSSIEQSQSTLVRNDPSSETARFGKFSFRSRSSSSSRSELSSDQQIPNMLLRPADAKTASRPE